MLVSDAAADVDSDRERGLMATKAVAPPWRSRIVGEGEEAPDQLLANPLNWRVHPKAQQDALAGVLSEVGWVQRVIVNQQTGHVVDGHARIGLAISRGEPSVPVLYVNLAPDEEAKVLATLDPIAALAGADKDVLDQLLREVSTGESAVSQLLSDLASNNGLTYGKDGLLASEAPEPEVDRAEELREKWGVRRGDLWEIGRHRLVCGDATDAVDVARCLAGEQPTLMVTDPPYGVEYDPHWRTEAAKKGHISFAAAREVVVANDDIADWRAAWSLFPGDVVYAWHADLRATTHAASLQAAGFDLRAQIIWCKSAPVISRGHYHFQHGSCWYAVRKGKTAAWVGDRSQSTVWHIPLNANVEGGHGTQKPLECMAHPIRNHEGDVYDPFLGTGTTMVAAEQFGRCCFALELEPKYVAVTLERLAAMGLEPRRVEAGEG
jgi:DNA modification methylase